MPIISARFANLLREIFADTYKGMMNAREKERERSVLIELVKGEM